MMVRTVVCFVKSMTVETRARARSEEKPERGESYKTTPRWRSLPPARRLLPYSIDGKGSGG